MENRLLGILVKMSLLLLLTDLLLCFPLLVLIDTYAFVTPSGDWGGWVNSGYNSREILKNLRAIYISK